TQWTLRQLKETYKAGRGLGRCLGPGRGPGGSWLIDLEGDGEAADDSLITLMGGEVVETLGHSSARGSHHFFTTDGERFLELLAAAGGKEGAGIKAGVWKLPALPDLEIRVGGHKEDGEVKQCQTAIPPTVGDDGKPREPNGVKTVAALPEAAYAFLEELAERAATDAAGEMDLPLDRSQVSRPGRPTAENRARPYPPKIDPPCSRMGRHEKQ